MPIHQAADVQSTVSQPHHVRSLRPKCLLAVHLSLIDDGRDPFRRHPGAWTDDIQAEADFIQMLRVRPNQEKYLPFLILEENAIGISQVRWIHREGGGKKQAVECLGSDCHSRFRAPK